MNRLKKISRKAAMVLLALAMTAAMMPGMTLTVQAADSVSYIERGWDGSKVTKTTKAVSDYTQVTANITTFDNGKWYVVSGDVTVSNRISMDRNITAHLILCDGVTLTALKGIMVPPDSRLYIYAQEQGTGALNASAPGQAAAIGGGRGGGGSIMTGGTIVIHGGNITAVGGTQAAGIGGGGWMAGCGPVTIYDGTVTATGGNSSGNTGGGAGIGGATGGAGHNGGGSKITIYGGTVTATGGQGTVGSGAGIGGGESGAGGSVYIYGGVVNANGGTLEGEVGARGIGAGKNASASNNGSLTLGPHIRLYGDDRLIPPTTVRYHATETTANYSGTRFLHLKTIYLEPVPYLEWDDTEMRLVEKTAIDYALVDEAAREFKNDWYLVDGRFTFYNRLNVTGNAHIILKDGSNLFTYNGGIRVNEGNSLSIYAQSTSKSTMGYLLAEGSGDGAAIGGNNGSNGGEITIHGGSFYLVGNNGGGAGIGGGSGGSGGTILIYGGDIDSIGGSGGGAGIGGGSGGSGGHVEIYGGEHSIEGRAGAAGIGGGRDGNGDWVGIYGGQVWSTGDNANGDINKYGMGIGQGYGGSDNGVLDIGSGMYVYGGDRPQPTTNILPHDGEYERQQYMIVNNRVPPHSHVFSYSAEGAVITAKCIGPGSCPQHYDSGITLTLRAEGGTYDGTTSYGASLAGLTDFNRITGLNVSEAQIEYYKGSERLDGAPVNAGTYTAKITVERKTASVDFTVSPLDSTVTTAPAAAGELTYTGQPQALVTAGEAANGTMQYALGNETGATEPYTTSIPEKTDAGSYFVWYKVQGNENYSDTEPVCIPVVIAKAEITILAENKSSLIGEPLEELTYTISGSYFDEEDLGITLSTTATQSSELGDYPITVSWNGNENYNAELVHGIYSILSPVPVFYTVVFTDGQGNTLKTEVVERGDTVTAPDAPEREGYVFDKWLLNGTEYDFAAPVTGELTITAGWLEMIAVPEANELTYTGLEQSGVEAMTGYALSGEKATNAGTYTATAALENGYIWEDGSSEDKEIPYTIEKAALTAVYAGEVINAAQTPQLTVTVEGFVNGETASTAQGYAAPVVAAPASIDCGQTYALVPAGGEADNYEFSYTGGNLVIEDHSWNFTGFTWTKDEENGGYTAQACFTCAYNEAHANAVDAEVTVSEVPATCEETGAVTYAASLAASGSPDAQDHNDEKTEATEALGHDYVSVVTPATCTEQGYTTYTCSRCGDSYKDDYTDALGHDYQKGETVAPTCTEQGYTTYTCSRCGDSYQADFEDALGHDYVAVVTEPTDTEQGYTTYTCSRCGDSYVDDYVDALGHDYVATVTPPTCTERGYTTYTCSRCGDSYVDDYTDMIPHNPAEAVEENRTEPNCSEAGSYDEVVYCTECGTEISRTERKISALGHDYQDTVIPPTCTEQGCTEHVCSRCGDSYQTDFTDALGHDFGEPKWTWAADYSAATAAFTCERCETTQTVTAAVTSERVEPTLEEDGLATYTATAVFNDKTYTDSREQILKYAHVTGIKIRPNKAEMPTLGTLQLKAEITPADATDQKVRWSSSDPSVATVDANGLVTAKVYGKVTITATTEDGGYTAACEIQTRFYDVMDKDAFYFTPVYWAADKKVTKETVKFSPTGNSTRKTVMLFLYRLAGSPAVSGKTGFKDVDGVYGKNSDTYKAILWGYKNGIVKGYSNGNFGGEDTVTRKQVMIMLYRMKGRPAVSGSMTFTDVAEKYGKNSDTYKAILWGTKNGLTNGYSDGTFRPEETCLRRQIVYFIYKYDKKFN